MKQKNNVQQDWQQTEKELRPRGEYFPITYTKVHLYKQYVFRSEETEDQKQLRLEAERKRFQAKR